MKLIFKFLLILGSFLMAGHFFRADTAQAHPQKRCHVYHHKCAGTNPPTTNTINFLCALALDGDDDFDSLNADTVAKPIESISFFSPKDALASSLFFDGQHFAFHQKVNFFALKGSFLI